VINLLTKHLRKISIGLVITVGLVLTSVAAVHATTSYVPAKVVNTKYPDIVAKVYSEEITGAQLTSHIAVVKNNWEKINKPKTDTECEKLALQQLVKNALLDHEAQVKGITTNEEEAKNSVTNTVNYLMSLNDNDTNKAKFLEEIKETGFSDPNQYENDPTVIGFYQKSLTRGKVQKAITDAVPLPTNDEIKNFITQHNLQNVSLDQQKIQQAVYQQKQNAALNQYIKQLVNGNSYQLFVPIDIKM
jgi:hypothetical protein